MRALVIEDEHQVAEINKRVLESEGFEVVIASTCREGESLAAADAYDFVVTDLMLPDGHGLDIVRSVRAGNRSTPILVITGVDEVETTVAALDNGADDYLRKPYEIQEMRARIRALMRRGQSAEPVHIACGDIEINRMTRDAKVNAGLLNLSPKEFTLLEYFMTHPGKVIRRAELLEKVWRMNFETGTNIVDVNIARLRAKLAAAGTACRIDAVRGVGYRLTEK